MAMDLVEATQVLRDEAPSNSGDELRVGTLKIGSQTHIISRGFNRIGRSPQCQIVINDVTVSKVHAEIQAGAEAAFVSDLRSSNGTKIKDVSIKPFYYYSINDGDAIYFGKVKAVFATARSTATEDVLLVPETPVAPRNRSATGRFSTGAGNISESFLNNSSVYESDTSMIPGTQETERKRPTFQRPSTPVQRSPSSRKVEAASNGSGDAVRKSDMDGTTKRDDVEATPHPPGAKRPRLQERNTSDGESNIHELETQAMPSPISKRKEPVQPRRSDNIFEAETQRTPIAEKRTNRDDIFEAETQILPVAMSEKPKYRDDIFEAETQGASVAIGKKKIFEQRKNQDIFEAETQALPVAMGKKKILEERENQDDIFEAETQVLSVAMGKKKILEEEKNQDDIFEAETQALPVAMGKKKKFAERENQDIFEAETQGLPVAMGKKKILEERENQDDIFEAETQVLSVAMGKKKIIEQRKNQDIFEAETQALPAAMGKKKIIEQRKNQDIFEAETQGLPAAMGKKKILEGGENEDEIFEAETQAMEVSIPDSPKSIFEAETQAMEISAPKSGEKVAKRPGVKILEARNRTSSGREANSIYEAETQMAQVQIGRSESVEPVGIQENIHELATQILDKNRSSTGGNSGRMNETVESSFRSNSSRDRLRLSSTPPSSPENVEIEESQNLLEIVETPLLAYEKNCEKISSIEDVPVAREESKIGGKKSRVFRRVRTIPESSESETDDEKVSPRFVRKSKPSNVIEDSSEEPTDEENVFGGSPLARAGQEGAATRNAGPAAAQGRPEQSKPRSSPLRTRKSDERDDHGGEKKDVSISGDSPTDFVRRNDGILRTVVDGRLPRGRSASGDSPADSARKNVGISRSVIDGTMPRGRSASGDSPADSARRNDGISRTVVHGTPPRGRSASGDSPADSARRNDGIPRTVIDLTPPRGRGQSGDSPTDSARRNDGISRNVVDGAPQRGRNESGDSPTDSAQRNDGILKTAFDGTPPRGRGESGDSPAGFARSDALSSKKIGETLNGKSGRSSVHLLGRKDQDSPGKNRGEASGAKSNLLGDSPSGNENAPKKFDAASMSKFARSPLRLPRKGDRDSPKETEQETPGRVGAKSNLFGDSPEKDNGSTSKNQGKSPDRATNSKQIGKSPKNPGKSPEGRENSKKIGDSPGRTNDSLGKIQAEKSGKFQPRSNMFGRPSLRLPRKGGDPSSKRITDKSPKEEDDIFEASTQRVVYDSVGNASAARKVDQREGPATENDDMDIDLLPTQILDVPSSTPLSRRSKYRKNRAGLEQLDGDDLHSAPTQILKESPRGENTDDHKLDGENLHGAPSRILRKSPRSGNVVTDRNKTNDGGKTIDLDDSIATNLENLLGEEANNDCLDDEGTQLMTQNLVDILRPTQSFSEDTPNRKSSPRTSADNFGCASSTPARRKIYAPATLGFVDGEARNSSRELVSADPSPIKAATENIEIAAPSAKNDEPEPSAHLPEDDIFLGLPEVRICGTLSNPGSPSSSSSSHGDFPARLSPSKKRPRNSPTRPDSPDSPITPKKSRVTKRSAASYKILEDALDDSDEDFDYLDLKRMADRLLASDSRCEGKSRRATSRPSPEKFDKIPVPIARKSVERTKIGKPKRRAVKLSGGPSSSPVSGVKDENSSVGSADSSGETRKSGRRRKPAGAPATAAGAVNFPLVSKKEQGGEESQEVEAILGKAVEENRPMVSRKSYAKMKMAKRNVEAKVDDAVAETPKVTRKRRTVSVTRAIPETPVATPTRARRTIAGAPGIPGDDEDRKILFTGVRDDKYDRIVEKLGGTVVSDPSEATVLITDKVRRTFKFLCAVGRGIRVVSINWLLESGKSSRFLDCGRFTLKDAAVEAKFKFSLEKSLQIARTKKLLDGYTIIVTPKVNQPEIHELKGMVEACGGRLLVRPGRNWSAKTVIISRAEDYAVAKAYLAKAPKNLKITVQSTEFILTGILRQEVNLVEHELKFV